MASTWPESASIGPDVAMATAAAATRGPARARSRAIVWLTLGFWVSNFLLLTLGTALAGNPHLVGIAGMRALAMLFGLLLCYGLHRVLSRPGMASLRKRILFLALVAPIAAEGFAWVTFFAEAAADPTLSVSNFTWSNAVRTISFWTWFFLAWAGLYLALSYSFDVQEERQHSAELQAQAHAAQLRALHSQINPHFLFNSLNSVSALILDGRSDEAEAMVTRLSQFLRMGLAVDPSATISLTSEIALQRAYLDIERLRYPDLEVVVALPAELEAASVPSLILQPVVENAVKYGVSGSPPPARIVLAATQDGERLRLEVRDSGSGANQPAAGAGIGLRHVGERLRLLYGGEAGLEHGRLAEGGYRVVLTMPLERTT